MKDHSCWKITYNHFKPAEEALRESLCTLANGYFGTRGAACHAQASKIHYPGTYIAGVYNKLSTDIANRAVPNEDIVNCPNWLPLTFKIGGGDWLNLGNVTIVSYHQELDLQQGILIKKMRLKDKRGRRTTIEMQRIVHMANPHRAAMSYSITPENYEGWIVVKTALDGSVQNRGVVRYKDLNSVHLKADSMGTFDANGIYLSVLTSQSNIRICQASKINVTCAHRDIDLSQQIVTEENNKISQEFKVLVHKGRRYKVEKTVSIYTSRDKGLKDPLSQAIGCAKKSAGFNSLFESHKRAWSSLWGRFDIKIKGDDYSQRLIRFHIFHLLQTASIHNTEIDAGLPARGLHGEAYRGHIFWDEIFVMHFFDFHLPEVSRALLLYRYNRLGQARKYAKENGYKGAMFPWQSGSVGDEETQTLHLNPKSGKWDPDYSRNQRHVSFAIAYNIWQYWVRTADLDFIRNYGAEVLLSIAKFASSLCKYDPKDRRYHTHGLMGPDEFHEKKPKSRKPGLKDNAYTNLLIAWTLLKAKEILGALGPRQSQSIIDKLGLSQSELRRWDDISRKMNIIIDEDGVISQFDGYSKLRELNWFLYKMRYINIRRLDRILKAEGLSPDEFKIAKQADAMMIFYLLPLSQIENLFSRLGYNFNKEMLRRNYEYYIRRTSHGSTLSKVVYCYIAHLLGKTAESMSWFIGILKSDINDTQGGTTKEGIHTGVMGGSIDIIMRGFVGLNIIDDKIIINPNLPDNWERVKFKLLYKGNLIALTIIKQQVILFIEEAKYSKSRVTVEVNNKLHYLRVGNTLKISLETPERNLF
ncbi:glycoside hydrolase family 65 protein [Candidatus Omnitrophota bacterium]